MCLLADAIGSLFLYDLLTQQSVDNTTPHGVTTTSRGHMTREATFLQHVINNPSHSFNLSSSSQSQLPFYRLNQSTASSQRYGQSLSNDSSPSTNRKNPLSKANAPFDDVGPINFEVDDIIIFGSPLPFLLAYRLNTGLYRGRLPRRFENLLLFILLLVLFLLLFF